MARTESATAPAPQVIVLRGRPRVRLPWWIALPWWLIRGTATTLGMIVLGAVWVGRQSTTGRYRHRIAPLWLAVLVAIPWHYRWDWAGAAAAWQTAGAIAFAAARHAGQPGARPRLLSARERALLGWALTTAGTWHMTRGLLPAAWWWGTWPALTIGFATPWWLGRRYRPVVDDRDEWEIAWADRVTDNPDADVLAGTVLTLDRDARRYRLTVPPGGRVDAVAKADGTAASLLGLHRGAITIGPDPDRTINDYLVAFSDRGGHEEIRYWDGGLLDPDGAFDALETDSGDRLRLHLRKPGVGAAFIAAMAPTGGGKGSTLRLAGVVAALDPLTLQLGVDGGRGKGLGYLRDGMRALATTREEWEWLLAGVDRLMDARADRYGKEGRDSWWASARDPQIWLTVDELPQVMKSRWCAQVIERISMIGRSLGVSGVVAAQKGAEEQWGSTVTRSNWMSGGASVLYRADDLRTVDLATQSWSINLAKLPTAPGWAYAVSGLEDRPPIRGRVLWLPNRLDVAERGHAEPHGTVEDFLRHSIHPRLLPEDEDALRLADWDAGNIRPKQQQLDAAPGMSTGLALVKPEPAGPTARERLLAAVPPPPDALRRSEIADLAEVPKQYAKVLLGQLVDGGDVRRVGEGNDTRYQQAS
jgi:hypothetical protein